MLTSDGYLLNLFRIQTKNSSITENKKVLFLQHGLFDSSDTFLINDEELAPGFFYANKGFDVWIGNSRGNKYNLGKFNKVKGNYFDFGVGF